MAITIEEILAQIKPVVAGWIKTAITQYNQTRYSGTTAVSSLFTAGASSTTPRLQAVSDIADSLGVMTYGELRVGTGDPASEGASPFSGVRIAYPPLDYASASWNIAGVDNDVLQFGLSASNGAAYFGSGSVILTASGIQLTSAPCTVGTGPTSLAPESQIRWKSSGCVISYIDSWLNSAAHTLTVSASSATGEATLELAATGASTTATLTAASIAVQGGFTVNASAVYPPYIVRKTAIESVTSSSVLQDDDVLFFPIGANEIWVATIAAPFDMAAAGGVRAAITTPAAFTNFFAAASWIGGTSAGTAYGRSVTSGGNVMNTATTGTAGMLYITISVANGANAGNVTLQWAQQVSNATATRCLSGAVLQAQRVS